MMRTGQQVIAFLQRRDGVVGLAQLASAFGDGLEHRLHVGRRGGDHVEDVGAAGLVAQRFFQIARLGLHLIEQPRVVDRNHGLVREGFQQANLGI